ncbi:MAG: CotH kinase family protein [Treponema sp.]|nr:CotH kinase family protein [Treponema sp.]
MHIQTKDFKAITSTENYVKASYSINKKTGDCKIRGRGNSTWEMKKKPYLLKFENAETFLDMPKAEKWVLMANGGDSTNLRNAYATYLAHKVWNNFKWTPNYRFVNLYINGRFEGLYQVYEKIEASESRLDIPDPNTNFNVNGSFIMVTDTRFKKPINFRTNRGIRFSMYSPRTISEKMKNYLVEGVNKFEDFLFGENFANPETGYRKYIDVDSFVDWYLINEYTLNRDARFRDSCYLYYDTVRKLLVMGPIWDFDISCGNNSYEGNSKPEGYWIKVEASWYKRLFEDPWFVKKVTDRWFSTQTELQNSFAYIYSLSRRIKPACELNDKAWQLIGHYQWPHATGWQKRKTYDDEVDYFMKWLQNRRDWLNQDLEKYKQEAK